MKHINTKKQLEPLQPDWQNEQMTSFAVLRTRVGLYAAGLALAVSVVVSAVNNYIGNSIRQSNTPAAKPAPTKVVDDVEELKRIINKQRIIIDKLKT